MSSLLVKSMEDVCMMEKTRLSDGEGGFITQWTEGATFKASINFDTSMQARVADKQGVTSLYTVTTLKNAQLEFHDVIKRLSDGKIFRITSDGDDKKTPSSAAFGQYLQVTAEEWKLA